jgi:Pro-kumamolisin, activation domain
MLSRVGDRPGLYRRVSHRVVVVRRTDAVRGKMSQLQSSFKIRLNTYRTSNGETFYSASVEPAVPAEIASKISGVLGLTESKQLTPFAKIGKSLGENPEITDGG